ncbi:MAG TPA: alpha-glucan family phosphorylase [Candidatus Cloacimonetes bacterium]|nr:alpha-glucan family phosphorylase [Candidatus Cloacimonadota bacterium]
MRTNINFKSFYVKPKLPVNLEKLSELSQNLWSTWDSDAYRLFLRIDPELYRKFNHNPVKFLQRIPEKRLMELSEDKGFLFELEAVYKRYKNYLNFVGHFSDKNGIKKEFDQNLQIAYLSMEFGLHESLPIYSGGLGVLAGDHLKAASDMGLPLIAFGILYRYGYFFQKINIEGKQEEFYQENDWYSKPVQKLKNENGQNIEIKIKLNNENIYLNTWMIEVGKIPLYLIDSNHKKNKEKFRKITDYLYVADKEMRLLQELVFGFGSMELIKKLQIQPTIFHLNEGHSAFIILKRMENLILKEKFESEEAKEIVRASTVFTTHTPIPAGNETFDLKPVEFYVSDILHSIGMDFREFKKSALIKGNDKFSLPALAIRFSKYINGVSKLHCQVSKEMWHPIYPQLFEKEMPIRAITNGVHLQSWLSRRMTQLFDRYLGEDYRHRAEEKTLWENVFAIPDIEIWEAHQSRKEQMISFMRSKLQDSMIHKGGTTSSNIGINNVLNNNHLIVGFARRFAPYKRANLILKDKERILKLLNNETRPIQFIFAGKAHPADEKGKAMIKEIIDFARENKVEDKFVFIENYDMNIARHLVQGVDVWLNNPIKPLEASGTSGMKAGMNGALNLSVLDGWWDECYNRKNGWAITSGENISDLEIREKLEANEIYELLENEVLEIYYNRDQNDIPRNWIKKMKQSIFDVGKNFNMHRVLEEYLYEFYLPGAENIGKLSANNFAEMHKLLKMEKEISKSWSKVKFLELKSNTQENLTLNSGEMVNIKAKIDLDGISENLVQVEVFYMISENDFKTIPLYFEERQNNIAIFEGHFKIQGSGKQSFNVRIKPKSCCLKDFYEYGKWHF